MAESTMIGHPPAITTIPTNHASLLVIPTADNGLRTAGITGHMTGPMTTAPSFLMRSPITTGSQGAQYASRISRRGGIVGSLTPAQAARLEYARSQADKAVRAVQEREPYWQPQPSIYNTVEGQIRHFQGRAEEAEARLQEQIRNGIGPGTFGLDSFLSLRVGQLEIYVLESANRTTGTAIKTDVTHAELETRAIHGAHGLRIIKTRTK